MKIAINALSARRGGGQTYLKNLLENFDQKHTAVLICNTENSSIFQKYKSENIEIFVAKFASHNILNRVLWELLLLPSWLKAQEIGVYFAPGGIMLTRMPETCTSATMLRNMLPFDDVARKKYPKNSWLRLKFLILRTVFIASMKSADRVIFISNHSKKTALKHTQIDPKRYEVIYHGINENFRNIPRKKADGSYFLYVSILDVYKSQKNVVENWKKLISEGFDKKLILAGPSYNEYGEQVQDMLTDIDPTQIEYLGEVSHEQLAELYHGAEANIFASTCECCPNILLEKLAAGKPVFCSSTEPMPEFAGDSAIFFDPTSNTDLAEKIIASQASKSKFELFGEKAYEQARQFCWDTTSQKTIEFITKGI